MPIQTPRIEFKEVRRWRLKKLVTLRYPGRAWSGDSMHALSDTILLTDMESKRDSTDELSLLYLFSPSKIEARSAASALRVGIYNILEIYDAEKKY